MATELETWCPWCGYHHELHSGKDDEHEPEVGDISFCWRCRQIGVYDNEMTDILVIRRPTKAEYEEALTNAELRELIHLTQVPVPLRHTINRWRTSS